MSAATRWEWTHNLSYLVEVSGEEPGLSVLQTWTRPDEKRAALIAAAPELADALEAYLDCLGGGFLIDASKPIVLARIEGLHLAARAALAKARLP